MSTLRIAVVKETAAHERRVALDPDGVKRLQALGAEVLVETGAGTAAWFADEAYQAAGARLLGRSELVAEADLVLSVGPPAEDVLAMLRPGQSYLGLLAPLINPELVTALTERGVTMISL
ncbi:MAG TPA: NAD(P)(+) transhydrogenase (Re/Si-specific) subunit alpha, partial [Jatrophihabitans sp.]